MQSCINCYHSSICKSENPDFYKKHFENSETCVSWENENVDYYDE